MNLPRGRHLGWSDLGEGRICPGGLHCLPGPSDRPSLSLRPLFGAVAPHMGRVVTLCEGRLGGAVPVHPLPGVVPAFVVGIPGLSGEGSSPMRSVES